MLMPSIFGENLFDGFMDDFMDDFAYPAMSGMQTNRYGDFMRTDAKETDDGYELDIDLPGATKDDVKLQLKDGYLMVGASKNADDGEKDKDGKYIWRERSYGSMSRSFYVGNDITEKDIHARFDNGTLKLTLPKSEADKVEADNYIAIEG